MNHRQGRRKLARRRAHGPMQKHKLTTAISEATEIATWEGSKGRLKKPRTPGTKTYSDAFLKAMGERNYVPNGKGGWRPVNKTGSKRMRMTTPEEKSDTLRRYTP